MITSLTLHRLEAKLTGIFGQLQDDTGQVIAATLEHSYCGMPKVAAGTYTCVRHAPNRLPYETFEVTNVPDFQGQSVSGILIHCGNFDRDSAGCILVGTQRQGDMVTQSRQAFGRLMDLLAGQDRVELVIQDAPPGETL